jgi:predicted nucleic acid-binding protein
LIVFFDASALIYLIEGKEPFATSALAQISRLQEQYENLGSAVSRLSWLECRVRPARAGLTATLAAFDEFFALPDLRWIELSRNVIELATAVRVEHGLRTPDALQAASCLQLGDQHSFITGDAGFKKVRSLNVSLLA